MEEAVSTWSLPQRIALRFAVLYLGLFFLGDFIGSTTLDPLGNLAAKHVWHLPTPLPSAATGSGDRLIDWMQAFAKLVLALLGTVIWTLFDRKRNPPNTTYEVLRVMLRYVLGFTLLSYGFGKAGQFSMPSLFEYAQPLGETTPMGLLWSFMGYSVPYSIFAGVLEVTGAFLLFFRRTTTLGAALYAGVMLNVFVLNLCYDVPVKLNSFHLLLGALILLLPDVGRLFDVLVLNRPTQPRVLAPPIRYRNLRIGVLALKWSLVAFMLYIQTQGALEAWRENHDGGPLRGFWTVKEFHTKKEEPWDWVTIEQGSWGGAILVHLRSGAERKARFEDDGKGVLTESTRRPKRSRKWNYHLEGDRLILISLDDPSATITLERDASRFPLARHGFHWVQEHPRTP